MRAGNLRKQRSSGLGRLAAILVLMVYVFGGGIHGFGAIDGSDHASLETLHLPGLSRAGGINSGTHFTEHTDSNTTQVAAITVAPRPDAAPTLSAAPPPITKDFAAPADLAQLVQFVLDVLSAAHEQEPYFASHVVASASPERWLRTVVLHL
jgi:hypothetical protein